MDGFSGSNQIKIKLADQHKTVFICPWGIFAYRKMPFGLKITVATFQWDIYFSFHDLKCIIKVYLYDLAAHSRLSVDHSDQLCLVFKSCHWYKTQLNPQKCIFCVRVGHLLGFIVTKEGIRVDPLKVEEILQLSPPRTIRHLQNLQGMVNFLRIFVVNFANLTKGFMRLLKKDTLFIRDERAQEFFDALNKSLASPPMLRTPEYSHDFLLYVVASQETIGMLLVQADGEIQENIIYYLNQNIIDSKLRYSHIDKLALVTIHAVQWLRHYILLRQTTIVDHINPFHFFLTR